VLLDDGITAPAVVKIIKVTAAVSLLEITTQEGRSRQIRRMCETVGIKLLSLERIKFAFLTIGELKTGQHRKLSEKEVQILKSLASRGK
jgi:23S rRNA pseudouridine2605 synthase